MTARRFVPHPYQGRSLRQDIVCGNQRLAVPRQPSHGGGVVWVIPHSHRKPSAGVNEDHLCSLYRIASCSLPANPARSCVPAHFRIADSCFFANTFPLRPGVSLLSLRFFKEVMNSSTSSRTFAGNPSNSRQSLGFAVICVSFYLKHSSILPQTTPLPKSRPASP